MAASGWRLRAAALKAAALPQGKRARKPPARTSQLSRAHILHDPAAAAAPLRCA